MHFECLKSDILDCILHLINNYKGNPAIQCIIIDNNKVLLMIKSIKNITRDYLKLAF